MAERKFNPMRKPLSAERQLKPFKAGDVLVVFGELFARGYANGIVDEAEKAGMKIIRSTVGRRDSDGRLRELSSEEAAVHTPPFLNIPLEAGFDLEPCAQDGTTPVDQLKTVKMSEWDAVQLDWKKIESSRARAGERFRAQTRAYISALEKEIPNGANVIFAHTMAGGVPRAKILMPTMNRVFKGTAERHLSSERFWNSDLGRLSEWNFEDVTARTLEHLIELSTPLRARVESAGGTVSYLAYGYHGTEVLIRDEYTWQSYAPYLQGWAKIKLEDVADAAWKKGVKASVFNCPEILTNSSSIFVGVEVPLYSFLGALRREGPRSTYVAGIIDRCQALLKPEFSIDAMIAFTDEALASPELQSVSHYDRWPEHNRQAQMERLIGASEALVDRHANPKSLITFVLSEEIFRATGRLMFDEARAPRAPVFWLGHDVLAKALVES